MGRGGVGFGLVALAAAVQLGCADPVPAEPGFEDDVRPILVARCVRCHGAGGMVNVDPLIPVFGAPSSSFLGEYEGVATGCPGPMEPPQPPSPTCHLGASEVRGLISVYIKRNDSARMPPPPSPALTEREIAIIDAWTSQDDPRP